MGGFAPSVGLSCPDRGPKIPLALSSSSFGVSQLQTMRGAPLNSQTLDAEADSEEPASRPAVETHRRDVPKVKRFTARFVNSSLSPVFVSIRVICGPFNLLPPP
jgi:hypothetical protein